MEPWSVSYFRSADGRSRVTDEIDTFGVKPAAKVYLTIDLLIDYGTSLSGKYTKHIAGRIWELRIDRYRVLYFTYTGRRFVMLRAFIKKSQRTPLDEIRIAEDRMQQVTRST